MGTRLMPRLNRSCSAVLLVGRARANHPEEDIVKHADEVVLGKYIYEVLGRF